MGVVSRKKGNTHEKVAYDNVGVVAGFNGGSIVETGTAGATTGTATEVEQWGAAAKGSPLFYNSGIYQYIAGFGD